MNNELLIFIPTYNERENVEPMLDDILALGLPADILFIDDHSPDGTGELVERIAASHDNVHVRHRSGKLGIGSAHADGIKWAYEQGYRLLLTMDCDFTHSPEYIRDFLAMAEQADIVVGSRYMRKESLGTWNAYRRVLTRLGHIATSLFLRMPYDATGAFRLYRLDRISRYFLDSVRSRGYSFFFESLYVLHLNGYRIAETPTHLPARVYGHSKMRISDALHSLSHLVHTYFTTKFNREQLEIAVPFRSESQKVEIPDPQGWNQYWSGKGNQPTFLVYDLIAAFYRKFIIKPSLNRFILGNFTASSRLLHAGCGSGQVDKDIGAKIGISALDISPAALSIYKKANKRYRELIHGSIFDIPVSGASFDGVYNLGVMEHFTEDEIVGILREFNRVLKPGGKIILFWPPEFGLSVMVLKVVHFVLNRLLRKNISLHPPEITRVRSRRQIEAYFARAQFELVDYSFGIGDLYTHAVIVGEKHVSADQGRQADLAESPCPVCNDAAYRVLRESTLGASLPALGYQFTPGHVQTYRIVKCRNCGHTYCSPRAKDLFRGYVDIADGEYMRNEAQRLATAEKVVARLQQYKKGGRLLDVGCSTGDFLRVARRYYEAEGLELSHWAAAIASERGLIVHETRLADLAPKDAYDLITLWGVIEHLEEPGEEIRQAFRLMKTGGILCIWTGNIDSLTARLLGWKWWYFMGQHIQYFSEATLHRLLTQSGFRKLMLDSYPYVLDMAAVANSLGRYPVISRIFSGLLTSRLLSSRTLTFALPGEMFAIYAKA